MELKLRWSVRKQKKADRVFDIHYVLIPASARPFLEGYTPYLDLENRVIIFRKNGEQNEQERTLELRWFVKKQKISGKTYEAHYVQIPKLVLPLLKGYTPYLDLEKKMIIFRKEGEKNE